MRWPFVRRGEAMVSSSRGGTGNVNPRPPPARGSVSRFSCHALCRTRPESRSHFCYAGNGPVYQSQMIQFLSYPKIKTSPPAGVAARSPA
jgi:hypothetical protein